MTQSFCVFICVYRIRPILKNLFLFLKGHIWHGPDLIIEMGMSCQHSHHNSALTSLLSHHNSALTSLLMGNPKEGGFGLLPWRQHVIARHAVWGQRLVPKTLEEGLDTRGRPPHSTVHPAGHLCTATQGGGGSLNSRW